MVDSGIGGRGLRGRGGRGRGGRAGRGGRVGRGGRGGRAAVDVTQSVTVEQGAYGAAEGEGQFEPAAVHGAMPAQGGAQAGVDPNPMGAVLGMLAQLLERFPGGMPAPVPVAPQGDAAMPGVVAPGVPGAVAEAEPVVPSYLRMMEHMQRLGTKFFSGGARPIESDEWRSRLERNFQSIRCPEEYRVDLAVHYLEGDAHEWWLGVAARRAGLVWTWDEFRREFDLKYFPREARNRLHGEFLYLTQGSRSVREFEVEFNRLKRFAGRGVDTEEDLISAFLRGMRIDLRNRCLGRRFESMIELVECAAQLEEGLRQEAGMMVAVPEAPRRAQSQSVASGKGGKSGLQQGQKRKWEDTSKAVGAGYRCFRCGSSEHRVADCTKADERVCFLCKEPGHLKTNCPKRAQPAARIEAPPAKRAATAPRVYTIGAETGEASGSRPITG